MWDLVHPVFEWPVSRVAEGVAAAVDVDEHRHWVVSSIVI